MSPFRFSTLDSDVDSDGYSAFFTYTGQEVARDAGLFWYFHED